MNKAVEYLDSVANHFSHRDWDYTRKINIRRIIYKKGSPEYNRDKISKRFKRAWRWITSSKKNGMIYDMSLWMKLKMVMYSFEPESHRPDGGLNSGCVLTFWEEDGEYIQMVQPSVGALLANFLKDEPNNLHAKKIIKELERILKEYQDRVDNQKVGN